MKKRTYRGILFLAAALLCALFCPVMVAAQDAESVTANSDDEVAELESLRGTIGWAEKVLIYPGKVLMQAKFVPGDESSSIHATKIKKFVKNGRDWVRFTLRDIRGEDYTIETEVLRSVNIRGKKGSIERYLVHLGVCIGVEYGEAELRLSNRAHKDFKILLGRNILAGKFVLDPSRSYMSKPACPDSLVTRVNKESRVIKSREKQEKSKKPTKSSKKSSKKSPKKASN